MIGATTETLDHDSLSLVFQQGNQACDRSDWAEAVSCYERCVRSAPEHGWALNNLGFALTRLDRFIEAEGYLRRALRLEPGNPRFLSNLIMCLDSGGHSLDAIDFRRTLAEVEPEAFDNLFHLAGKLQSVGCNEESLTYFRKAIALRPEHRVCRSNYLLACNYSDTMTVEQVALEHFRHAEIWDTCVPKVAASVLAKTVPQDRFRIGYLSGDFGHHPVGKLMSALLPLHDRSRVQLYGYSDRSKQDAWTKRVSSGMDVFRDVYSCSDDQLADMIRNDQLNVLLEMNGHTGGRNRLAVLNQRVAPIQASFLGYPNTTGLSGIDYFVTDEFCSPPGISDRLYREQPVRLTSGFLCFDPAIDKLPHGPSPFHQSKYVTFGTFNNPAKISPTAIRAWAEILDRVPGSVLRIKYGSRFESAWLRNRWRMEFARHGILPDRLQFCGAEQTLAGHYRSMAAVDLALDSFPYQGTTTTLETLAAGTPVLTLAGETYCRRASSAILLRHNWQRLVTTTVDEYIQRAVQLVCNRTELDQLRTSIQGEFSTGPVCDGRTFVHEMESFFIDQFNRLRNPAVFQCPRPSSEPRSLIVTCTGMPRSGSTWAYNVIRRLLEIGKGKNNRISASYRENLAGDSALSAALQSSESTVLKMHYPGPVTMRAIQSGLVRNIYTYRDPLASIASFREMFGGTVSHAAEQIVRSIRNADIWRKHSGTTLFIDYRELMADSRAQIRRIAFFLDLNVTEEDIAAVESQTNLAAVRRHTSEMIPKERVTLHRAGKSRYDPQTQYHVGHANKAESRNWRVELSSDEQVEALRVLVRE